VPSPSRPRSRHEARLAENARKAREKAARKQRQLAATAHHPLRLYRVARLATLLDVNEATLWKWRQRGILPEPVKIGSIEGWTRQQIEYLLTPQGSADRAEAAPERVRPRANRRPETHS
jgi:predicted DNA-binding transcriptional regulator AlpA